MDKSKKKSGKMVKGRPGLEIDKEILSSLKHSERPLSTSDIVREVGNAWHTVDRACLKLQLKGKVEGFKIGNLNLWRER